MPGFSFKVPAVLDNGDVARAWAQRGVRVFPCQHEPGASQKAPCPGILWQQQATTDARRIEGWWRRWPDALVGVSFADQALLIFDPDGDEGLAQWDALWAPHGGVPGDLPHSRTPGGGRHYAFVLPEGVTHGNGLGALRPKKEGGAIDVRGPGTGYIIAPGSIMPDGRRYEPAGGDYALLDVPELPGWLLDTLKAERGRQAEPAPLLDAAPARPAAALAPPRGDLRNHPRVRAWAEAGIEAEIAAMRGAGKGGRNHQLNTSSFSVGQMVGGGLLDRGTAENLLLQAAIDNGYAGEDPVGARKTIRSGLDSGERQPRDVPDEIAGEIEADQDAAAFGRRAAAPALVQAVDGTIHDEETGEVVALPGRSRAGAHPQFPDALTHVPGLLGEIVDWIEASSSQPTRVLALGAAIVTVGAAMGRYWHGPTEATQGMFILGMARTGVGKGAPLAAIRTLLNKAGMQRLKGVSEMQSQTGLINGVLRAPCSACCVDEIGSLMRAISNPRASSFETKITKTLRELWSTNKKEWSTPEWANRAGETLSAPQMSILGMTTPEEFFRALSSDDMSNGFLNRLLVLSVDERINSRPPAESSENPPTYITEKLRVLFGGGDAFIQGKITSYTEEVTWWQEIPWAHETVEMRYWSIRRQIEERCFERPQGADVMMRVAEMALRLAQIRAGGIDPIRPCIRMDDLEWGYAVASWSAEMMLHAMSEHMAETPMQRNAKSVLRTIREAGQVSKRDLMRSLRYSKREMDELLATLVSGELIEELKVQPAGGGAPRVVLCARE